MLIDWFTVGAQILNFVILLVALKFLLYDRIVEAMEERRQSIESSRREAEEKRREAQERAEELEEERHRLERKIDQILDEARKKAEERRQELVAEAQRRVEEQEKQWMGSLDRTREQLAQELQRHTAEKAIAVSRRALEDLADRDLGDEVVRTLMRRMHGLSDDERAEFSGALEKDGVVVVTTGFELDDDRRKELEQTLHELSPETDREVEWREEGTPATGVEIQAGSQVLSWTVDDYLDGVLDDFERMLREAAETDKGRDDESSDGDDIS